MRIEAWEGAQRTPIEQKLQEVTNRHVHSGANKPAIEALLMSAEEDRQRVVEAASAAVEAEVSAVRAHEEEMARLKEEHGAAMAKAEVAAAEEQESAVEAVHKTL